MKTLKLHRWHTELGAKMVPFANYLMPIKYKNMIQEHIHTREKASIFDVSHMGQIEISGTQSLKFIKHVFTSKIKKHGAKYGLILNKNGCILDDVICYHINMDKYMFCVNASNIEKIFNHFNIHTNKFPYVNICNVSHNISLLALQGPLAPKVFKDVLKADIPAPFSCKSFDNVFVAGTGYTGEKGCEIYTTNTHIESIWNILLKHPDVKPAGLGARDTLRLEKRYPLYGNELNENVNPLDSNLKWCLDMDGKWLGKEIIDDYQPKFKLVGIKCNKGPVPRHEYKLYDKNEEKCIGEITSGSYSPILDQNIAIGRVIRSSVKIGDDIKFKRGNKYVNGKVIKGSFV